MKYPEQQAVGIGCMALGGLLAAGAVSIPSDAGYAGVGANFLPWLVATALLVCGGWLVYEARSGGFRALEAPDDETAANWRCMAWVSAGLLLNALLITHIGFVLSCTLLFVLAARGFRLSMGQDVPARRMLRDAATGLVISAPAYWLFTKALGLTLPGLTRTGWI
jgi:putative tricarboxylic transport membrane protein